MPCLPGCWHCPPTTMFLSNFAIVYLFACLYYMIQTRNLGTPFMDSLTPQQKAIKARSVKARKEVFLSGISIGVVIILLWRPFTLYKVEGLLT